MLSSFKITKIIYNKVIVLISHIIVLFVHPIDTNIHINNNNYSDDSDLPESKKLLEEAGNLNAAPNNLPPFSTQRSQKGYDEPEKCEKFFATKNGSSPAIKEFPSGRIRARTVLWYLVFCGFAINHMMRITVNIAIVEMIKPKEATNKSAHVSECFTMTKNSETRINNSIFTKYDRILHENSSNTYNSLSVRDIVDSPQYSLERNIFQFLQVIMSI